MSDVFIEQLLKRKDLPIVIARKLFIILGAISLSGLVLILIPELGIFIVVGIFFGAKKLYGNQNLEFEYIFTSGELDIDKIINQKKRKRVISLEVRSIEIMAKYNNSEYQKTFNLTTKTLNCSSGEITDDTYVIVYAKNNEMLKILIEPNEQMVKNIKIYAADKVAL